MSDGRITSNWNPLKDSILLIVTGTVMLELLSPEPLPICISLTANTFAVIKDDWICLKGSLSFEP